MFVDKLKIASKIWLPAIIFSIALIAVAGIAAMNLNNTLLQDRQDKVRSLVEEAHSVIGHFVKEAKAGRMTTEEAQFIAKETIRDIRYDKTEYFWINDMNHIMIMHGAKASLEGKKLDKLKDINGKYLFTEFIKIVQSNDEGAGFVDYYWPKAGHDDPIEKISYVKLSKDWGWIVGSGLYMDDVKATFNAQFRVFVILVIAALVIAGSVSWLVARSLTKGLNSISEEMNEVSSGNLTVEISGQNRADEIGAMAKNLNIFKQNAIEATALKDAQESQRKEAEHERKQGLISLADDLQHRMQSVISDMNNVVQNLGQSADAMNENANATSRESTSVASISQQTSQNVETVAAATEELNASSSEIGRQVEQTNQIAQSASAEASTTNEVIQGLSGAASRIGEVVSMIQDIAEQTNLLALNATIEAARAGEAGKGFAVVASEVKNLANQTARATDEVSKQILAIQTETGRAVDATNGIAHTINTMHEASSAIAEAVDQQHAAIQEISKSVQEASRGTQEISSHIAEVSQDADKTMASSNEVKEASQKLLDSSQSLDSTMSDFINDMHKRSQ